MENKIKEPIQQRSIEKKKKIAQAGYELFSEKGYYKINTADIAKAAGVSTGIVYRYFSDKKAIFMEAMESYFVLFATDLFQLISEISEQKDLHLFFSSIIDFTITSHSFSKSFFQEIEALSHYDDEISAIFRENEEKLTHKFIELLPHYGVNTQDTHEKIHFIINLIESYTHEMVYNKQSCKNYESLKELLIETCIFILK